ncbi:MAG: nucleotidyl transferase AbiEii/AbiGii toxin family protein [Chloroflexi bacterium]|nr:nucleotidyl transferase AbiEii/AbiGii toxin family protein [Chloroflexota bacterium]
MFIETLPESARQSLALLGEKKIAHGFYLAGGSALALHLGHRISVDLDFFTPRSFDVVTLVRRLAKTGAFVQEQRKKDTLLGTFDQVKVSFFRYSYPLIAKSETVLNTAIAGMSDIGAMKLDAIGTRGKKRDFIDLYYICLAGHTLEDVLDWYREKYKGVEVNLIHYIKALTYFEEAEADPMPRMLKRVSWKRVKQFFEREAPPLLRKVV